MNSLEAGIARCDMTPPPGTPLFGYRTERLGHVVHDELFATALVMRQGETVCVLVSVDICLIDEEEVAAIRHAVTNATGIAGPNVIISATHTHSAPITVSAWGRGEKNRAYLNQLRDAVVAAVVQAQSSMQPARIGIGVTTTDMNVNRRQVMPDGKVILGFNEWGPRDRDLTVVRFEGETGPIAQIVHLGAHPTSRGLQPDVSRDWPGVMTDRLETITNTPVLFINGAFGDVAPRTTVGGAVGDGSIAAQEVGLHAAGDAIRAWNSIREFHDLKLQTLTADIELPHAPLPPEDEVERQIKVYAEQDDASPGAWQLSYWRAVRAEHAATPKRSRYFGQTITRIGPVAIVPFGGEIFAEIALRLKQASPFTHTLCAGTTNGSHGYYVTREAYARGGFEVTDSRAYGAYAPAENNDDILVSENLKLLQQLKSSSPTKDINMSF